MFVLAFSILSTYLSFGELLCKLIVLMISLEEGIIIILDQIILCHLVAGSLLCPIRCCLWPLPEKCHPSPSHDNPICLQQTSTGKETHPG